MSADIGRKPGPRDATPDVGLHRFRLQLVLHVEVQGEQGSVVQTRMELEPRVPREGKRRKVQPSHGAEEEFVVIKVHTQMVADFRRRLGLRGRSREEPGEEECTKGCTERLHEAILRVRESGVLLAC